MSDYAILIIVGLAMFFFGGIVGLFAGAKSVIALYNSREKQVKTLELVK